MITQNQLLSCDGFRLSKLYKFYRQEFNPFQTFKLPLHRVQSKSLYSRMHKQFDMVDILFRQHHLDPEQYIKWIALEYSADIPTLKRSLLDPFVIQQFIDYLKSKNHKKRVLAYFYKTALFIAERCRAEHYPRAVDYIQMLIMTKKLAAYVYTGKISKYYLVLIPKFDQIVKKLDSLSKTELMPICTRLDMYKKDISEAMEQELHKIYGPFTYVDGLLNGSISAPSNDSIILQLS